MLGLARGRAGQRQRPVQRVEDRAVGDLAELGQGHELAVHQDQDEASCRDVERLAQRRLRGQRRFRGRERHVGSERRSCAIGRDQPHVIQRVWNEARYGLGDRMAREVRPHGPVRRGLVIHRTRRTGARVARVQPIVEVRLVVARPPGFTSPVNPAAALAELDPLLPNTDGFVVGGGGGGGAM